SGFTKPAAEPVWQGLLNTHDLLYVPRGWWYRNRPLGEHAMCLGLRFSNPTGADIVARLMQRLTSNASTNIDIPRFGGPEKQSMFLTYLQRELTEAVTEPGLLLGCLTEMRLLAEPRNRFCLPWSAQKTPTPPSRDWIVLPLIRFPEAGDLVHMELEDTCQII